MAASTQINPDTFEPIVIPGGGAGVADGPPVNVLQVPRVVHFQASRPVPRQESRI